MGKIEKMIMELCPEGVERVKLGEVCHFKRGNSISSKEAVAGNVPVISGGIKPSFYHSQSNRNGNSITVAGSGASAGYVNYWEIPIWVADAFTIEPDEKLSRKFTYLYLKNNQKKIFRLQKGAGVPHVHGTDLTGLSIPLPPLSIQQEIVSSLDTFTSIIGKMKKEVEMRKKQMEYYREKLLTFKRGECEWKEIQEVFDMRNGYTPSKSNPKFWENGTIPWFRMEDIRENGRILSDSILHITMKGVKNGKLFPANSFILATTATIGEHALIIADSLANQRFTNLKIRKSLSDKLLTKYVFYYLFIVDEWCKKNVNVSGFASVDMVRFKKYNIPIPPLPVQQGIVSILDAFEDYISKLEELIDLRQKQYEYYREKLLTFE